MPLSKIPAVGVDATGTPDSTTFFRGDNTWNAVTVSALSTASGSAPSYSARAWVNFNGTGTVAIRASGNVTSITDNGTGDYTVNFTTAMSDTNYSPQITSGWTPGVTSSSFSGANASGIATASLRISNVNNVDAAYDSANLNVAIFR